MGMPLGGAALVGGAGPCAAVGRAANAGPDRVAAPRVREADGDTAVLIAVGSHEPDARELADPGTWTPRCWAGPPWSSKMSPPPRAGPATSWRHRDPAGRSAVGLQERRDVLAGLRRRGSRRAHGSGRLSLTRESRFVGRRQFHG